VPGTYTVATLLDAVHPVERGWRAFRQCLSRSGRKSWRAQRGPAAIRFRRNLVLLAGKSRNAEEPRRRRASALFFL